MKSKADPADQPGSTPLPDDNPALQGEGNYTAARRHRASVKKFVDAGQVDAAAHEAAPKTPEEADALKAAEKAGLSHARR